MSGPSAFIAAVGFVAVAAVHASSSSSGIAISLRVGQEQYAPYEPVVVEYRLENRGDAPVEVPKAMDTRHGLVAFEVTDPAGRFHPYRTGPIACALMQKETLPPGAHLVGKVVMVSNQLAELLGVGEHPGDQGVPLPFASAGSYRVRARFALDGSFVSKESAILESNAASLIVRKATDREHEAASFFDSTSDLSVALGGESVGAGAQEPGGHGTTDSVQRWEEFVGRYGDTVYGPFVRMNLARAYRRGSESKVARPDLAIDHLRAVIRTGPASIVDDALAELAKAYIETNRIKEAESATTELLTRFPESEHLSDAKRIRDGLRAGDRTLREIFGH